ncbi:MAG: hypothetical protein GC168_03590 [Candidatus Hydrogenedens sp.]|nr:hypothetical protein [Candidatus Hydrogenedens sp.]
MKKQERGFVLIVTLWVLAIATVLTLSLGRRAFLDARAAAYGLEQTQARLMARAAVNRGVIEIRNKFYKDLLNLEEQNSEVGFGGPPEGTNLGQPWAHPMDLYAEGASFEATEEFDNDVVRLTIEDAESKININSAPREIIDNIPFLDRSVKRRIWTRRTGEEEDEEIGPSRFQAIEELRYLRGMDDEEWFGEDGEPGARDLLSVWGFPLININTASREVLACVPDLGEAAIEEILAYRGAPPEPGQQGAPQRGFKSLEEVQQYTSIQGDAVVAIQKFCTFDSRFFIITGLATRQGGKVRVECQAVVSAFDGAFTVHDWQERSIGA